MSRIQTYKRSGLFFSRKTLLTLYYGLTDPRTPAYAALPALAGLIYLISPIDLIPDFIPIAGYLDDMVIVSLLIKLSIRLFPPEVLEASLVKTARQSRRINLVLMLMLIVLVILIGGSIYLVIKLTRGIL